MNLFGSYRCLLGNSVEAISAAVEIYNKPRISYRDECCVILLVNGWELLLKALLAKNRQRLYYKKRRGEPYRSLSVRDCVNRAKPSFPSKVDSEAVAGNLDLLIGYRDQAIHYYNKPGLQVLLYALAQTSVVNFRDLVLEVFDRDITREITISLLPLSLAPPIDPVEFLRNPPTGQKNKEVAEFSRRVRDLVSELESAGHDTGRLLTVFNVHLVSTKKISGADLVVGVDGSAGSDSVLLVQRPIDPNKTHPYREIDVIGRRKDLSKPGLQLRIGSYAVGQYQFRALVFHYDVKSNPSYCWNDTTGAITRYSPAFIEFIKRLREEDLAQAMDTFQKKVSRSG
jgi:hypothetical protein